MAANKWSYLVTSVKDHKSPDFFQYMNRAGAEGWEAFAVTTSHTGEHVCSLRDPCEVRGRRGFKLMHYPQVRSIA